MKSLGFTIDNRVYIPYNEDRKEMEYADDFVILWYYYIDAFD